MFETYSADQPHHPAAWEGRGLSVILQLSPEGQTIKPICNGQILRLLCLLSQGVTSILSSGTRVPFWYPRLWVPSVYCIVVSPFSWGRRHSLCVFHCSGFSHEFILKWCLPVLIMGVQKKRAKLEKENTGFIPGLWGLSFWFNKNRIENTKGVGAGSFGELVGGKVKFKDAFDCNPHNTHYFILK